MSFDGSSYEGDSFAEFLPLSFGCSSKRPSIRLPQDEMLVG